MDPTSSLPRRSIVVEAIVATTDVDTAHMRKPLPKRYKAPPGSQREKMIRRASELYKAGRKKEAAELRERMEKKERKKRGFKQRTSR